MEEALKDDSGLLQDYEFLPYDLSTLMNYQEFVLMSAYRNLTVTVVACPKTHLDVLGTKYLESTEMWQPADDFESYKRRYKEDEVLDMQDDIQKAKDVTIYEQERDPKDIVHFNKSRSHFNVSVDEFYLMKEQESQIINFIIPEGTRDVLDLQVGEDNMKLCSYDLSHCFKARPVMTVRKFPGFASSSYQLISWTEPNVIISPQQFDYIIRQISPKEAKNLTDLPAQQLNLKLDHSKRLDKNELMRLKSMINTHVKGADSNKVFIFDYQEIKSKMDESLTTMLLFLSLITGLLFLMSFFQLLLSIEGNIKDNQWQIGVLRSMGMTKQDITSLVLAESTANILAAVFIGFLIGYVVMVSSMSVMNTMFEMPINFDVDWLTLGVLMSISILTVVVGTNLSVRYVNSMRIAKILKGQ